MEQQCIFCRIIAGEIPAQVLHRDDEAIVIRDISAQAPHHVLVIPLKHVPNLAEFVTTEPPEHVGRFFTLVGRTGRDLGAEGNRAVVNTGPAGGQTVDHLHVHVLAGRDMHWPPG